MLVKKNFCPYYIHVSISSHILEWINKCKTLTWHCFEMHSIIFNRKVSLLCASSPAIVHSISHAGCMMLKNLYKCIGTGYTEKVAHCLLISFALLKRVTEHWHWTLNLLNILTCIWSLNIQSNNQPWIIEFVLMKTY